MRTIHSMKARVLVVAGVASLVVPFVPAGPASAHVFNTGSSISINRHGNRFSGDVDSDRNSCERNRSVTLIRIKRNGDRVAEGSDRTNDNGRWSIKSKQKGRYQAVVSSRTRGRYGHSHTCRGASSDVIRKR